MRISDWSSDVCSSDLAQHGHRDEERQEAKTHTISPIAAIWLRPAAQRIACRVRISSLSATESLRLASRAIPRVAAAASAPEVACEFGSESSRERESQYG